MRVAIVEEDAVVMYDLHQPVELKACGRGTCRPVTRQAATLGKRYRVHRFWQIRTCPYCGRIAGVAEQERTIYLGDSEEDALEAYANAEASLMGRAA
jgi:hypothetical protein